MADIGQPAGQTAGGGLADLLGGVNRPALNTFVATSQARNGLVSAQTQDALIKAQQSQEEMSAHADLPGQIQAAVPGIKGSEATLMANIMSHIAGGAQGAAKFVAQMKLMYGDPAEQTAGQQGFEGKIAPPIATPSVSQTPVAPPGGSALGPVTVSPLGQAQIGNLNATAGLHQAQATNPSAFHPGQAPLDPQAVAFGAYQLYKTGKMPVLGMGNGPGRSAILAGAAQLAQQEEQNPGSTANPGFDTALANGQDFTAGQRSLNNFAGGPLGNQVRSINNVVGHLQLMEGLFNGLQNGDVQIANKLGAQWNKAFGSPVPTNIQTAAEFIGPELTKILSANGSTGTAEERQGFANTAANLANSPEQTAGAIGTLKGMLGRQMTDMALQYHGATGRSDFARRYVAPDVGNYLDINPEGGPPPAPGAAPPASTSPTVSASPAGGNAGALPPQALAQLKEGIHTTFGNGQVWTIQNGKPVRVQ